MTNNSANRGKLLVTFLFVAEGFAGELYNSRYCAGCWLLWPSANEIVPQPEQ
jgi:hypothetical protein